MRRIAGKIYEILIWVGRIISSWDINSWLENLFLKNRGKKIIAVAFAVALWFAANIEQDIEKNTTTELSYMNLLAGLIIVNSPPQALNLRIRGPRTQLASLSPKDMAIALDLSHTSLGISKFEIHTDQIKPPRGIQVIGISPAEVTIEIDKIAEKEVKVKPIISLPESGYEIVGEPKAIPSVVKIRGPRRTISQTESLSTDLISTVGVKSSFTLEVPLKVNPGIELIDGRFAKVTVNIEEKTAIKEFDDMKINLLNSDGVQFESRDPLKAQLVFEGPYSIIKNLNNDDIEVSVDLSRLKHNVKQKLQKLKVNVTYPYRGSLTLKKKVPDEIGMVFK